MMIESALKRDRLIVGLCLVVVSTLCWAYFLSGTGVGMMDTPLWSAGHVVLMFLMWWALMIAMMLPGASPVILLAAALNRRSKADKPPFGHTVLFTAAYLLAWAGFSIIAVAVQWWMQQNGWLNNMLIGQSRLVNGLLLLLAGGWQFSPWKCACLNHCQSPIGFLTRHRSPGRTGALKMGFLHGAYVYALP